jgi:transposase
MFLREYHRWKDGKDHQYWALVETRRMPEGPRQRTVCYLGELNSSLEARWRKTLHVFNAEGDERQLALFPAEGPLPPDDPTVVPIRLDRVAWERPRQLGNVLVGLTLWQRLELDTFWAERLDVTSAEVPWSRVAAVLAINRLCAPGSELAIEERWFPSTALDDLLAIPETAMHTDRLYRCLDLLLPHKGALEQHLKAKYGELFGATFDVLLYDLTSTYFEGQAASMPKAKRGYSRDHRSDCKQVLIALIVSVEGFPVAYEVFAGNRQDRSTLEDILKAVEVKYGAARRTWVFDRGVVSEANLQRLREHVPPLPYVVGTPKSAMKAFETSLVEGAWQHVREDVEVKCVPAPGGAETFVLCRSRGRQRKEEAMRKTACAKLETGLTKLANAVATGRVKDERKIYKRLGAVLARHPTVAALYTAECDTTHRHRQLVWRVRPDRKAWAELREGTYLLRVFGCDLADPAQLWEMYMQLTEAEAAFKALKGDLLVRPIWHAKETRVEAHILVAFLGYALWVALKHTLKGAGSDLSPMKTLQQLAKIQSGDILLETATGQQLRLRRVSRPDTAQAALLATLQLQLPERLSADVQM